MSLVDQYKEIAKYIGQSSHSGFFHKVLEFDEFLDNFFGISFNRSVKGPESVENTLYKGIRKEALCTSYLDYHQILLDLPEKETIVDLGAGLCRGTLLAREFNYNRRCLSIEFMPERATVALEKYPEDTVIDDMTALEFKLPMANYYFLYLPLGELTNSFIRKLHENNRECFVYIIESHGNLIETIRKLDFFSFISSKIKCSTPRHNGLIHKFHFKPSCEFIDMKPATNLVTNWKYFVTKYSHTQIKLQVSSKVANKVDTYRTWEQSIEGAYLVSISGELTIYFPSIRRFLLNEDIPIGVVSYDS